MKFIRFVLYQNGMSRGDHFNGGGELFVLIIGGIVTVITIIFKIYVWITPDHSDSEKPKETIEEKLKISNYDILSKEELVDLTYERMTTPPLKEYFKNQRDFIKECENKLQNIEENIRNKDVIYSNLSEKNIYDLRIDLIRMDLQKLSYYINGHSYENNL